MMGVKNGLFLITVQQIQSPMVYMSQKSRKLSDDPGQICH